MAVAFSFIGIVSMPSAVADCPDPPRDCSSVTDLVDVVVGNSAMSMGVYENAPQESESNAGSMHPQSQHGSFGPGDHGGVLVIVRDPGDATSLSISFQAEQRYVDWSGSNELVMDRPGRDSYHVLPFTAGAAAFSISFTVNDGLGNMTTGQLQLLDLDALLRDTPTPSPVAVIAALAVAVLMAGRRKGMQP